MRACPEAPADKLWVDVCDRGADLFEFLATEQSLGRCAWCVRRTTAVFASVMTATVTDVVAYLSADVAKHGRPANAGDL